MLKVTIITSIICLYQSHNLNHQIEISGLKSNADVIVELISLDDNSSHFSKYASCFSQLVLIWKIENLFHTIDIQ